jgi:cyclic pyranopterin phosphate synthase
MAQVMTRTGATVVPLRAPPDGGLRDGRGRALHDLRISVMDRCNFRCPYCMPESTYGKGFAFLPAREQLDFEELTRLARLFVAAGVRKLRLTGGEPLLRPNLAELIAMLRALGPDLDLALTTNAVLLAQHAPALKAAGLDRITVSLDSLDPAVFAAMSGGRGSVARVLEGIEAAREAGFDTLKINTVVQRGVNDHTVLDLLERFRGTGVVVRLIEYMDVGSLNDWSAEQVLPARELLARIGARWPLQPLPGRYRGEVAQRWTYADGAGEIGVIASVSAPFCGDCTRARLSSDGMLYTCLFASAGTDLKGPLRAGADDAALAGLVDGIWRARGDRYSEERSARRAAVDPRRIEMYYIGG